MSKEKILDFTVKVMIDDKGVFSSSIVSDAVNISGFEWKEPMTHMIIHTIKETVNGFCEKYKQAQLEPENKSFVKNNN